MTEGKIVSWTKSEGDRLSKGESVVVVESDKADMDVESFHDGILAAIVVPEGESAPVGAAIAFLAESEEEVALARAKAESQSTGDAAAPAGASAPVVETDGKQMAAPAVATSTPAVTVVAEGPKKIVATPHAMKLAKQHKVVKDLRCKY
jgi:pyruvate dehydrogenase E2 component (dihydrolipoamide acetyltransferase)